MMELVVMRIVAFVTLGAVFGFAYLAALGLNVHIYLGSGSGWVALLVQAVRWLVIGGAFALCARQGALPLVSNMIGFQISRTFAISRWTRELEDKP